MKYLFMVIGCLLPSSAEAMLRRVQPKTLLAAGVRNMHNSSLRCSWEHCRTPGNILNDQDRTSYSHSSFPVGKTVLYAAGVLALHSYIEYANELHKNTQAYYWQQAFCNTALNKDDFYRLADDFMEKNLDPHKVLGEHVWVVLQLAQQYGHLNFLH